MARVFYATLPALLVSVVPTTIALPAKLVSLSLVRFVRPILTVPTIVMRVSVLMSALRIPTLLHCIRVKSVSMAVCTVWLLQSVSNVCLASSTMPLLEHAFRFVRQAHIWVRRESAQSVLLTALSANGTVSKIRKFVSNVRHHTSYRIRYVLWRVRLHTTMHSVPFVCDA